MKEICVLSCVKSECSTTQVLPCVHHDGVWLLACEHVELCHWCVDLPHIQVHIAVMFVPFHQQLWCGCIALESVHLR